MAIASDVVAAKKMSLLAEEGQFSLLVFTRARERDDDDSIAALVEAQRGEGFVRKIGPGEEVRMRGLATFPSVRAAYAAKDALLEHPAVEFLSWGSDYDLLFKP